MIVFDQRYLPVVFVVTAGEHQESDFAQYQQHFRAWHAERRRLLVLSDPRAQEIPSARWRKRFAELADEIDELAPNVTFANAAVLGSTLLVGAARAVSWLRKRTDDTHYSSTAREALEWLTEKGRPAGIVPPAKARDLAQRLDEAAKRGEDPLALVR